MNARESPRPARVVGACPGPFDARASRPGVWGPTGVWGESCHFFAPRRTAGSREVLVAVLLHASTVSDPGAAGFFLRPTVRCYALRPSLEKWLRGSAVQNSRYDL